MGQPGRAEVKFDGELRAASLAIKAGREPAISHAEFNPPATAREHLQQAALKEIVRNGRSSAFSGTSDDFILEPQV